MGHETFITDYGKNTEGRVGPYIENAARWLGNAVTPPAGVVRLATNNASYVPMLQKLVTKVRVRHLMVESMRTGFCVVTRLLLHLAMLCYCPAHDRPVCCDLLCCSSLPGSPPTTARPTHSWRPATG